MSRDVGSSPVHSAAGTGMLISWATVPMHDKSAGTGGTIAGMCSVTLQM